MKKEKDLKVKNPRFNILSKLLSNTLTVLVKRCGIKDGSIAACNELVRQVSAIVECQTAPAISSILGKLIVWLKRINQAVETIVVPRCTICDVPRTARVVKSLWVHIEVVHGRIAFIDVNVSGQNKVDIILQEKRLEDFTAVLTDCATSVRCADIPRAVTGYDDQLAR